MIATTLQTASPRVQRQARQEWELDHELLDAVFAARTSDGLRVSVSTVFHSAKYGRLPKYRQLALEAYTRGAIDAMARSAGIDRMMPPMRTAPAKVGKNRKRVTQPIGPRPVVPNLHPSPGGVQTPLPSWLANATGVMVPPPPGTRSPFPPASDLSSLYGQAVGT